MEANPFAGFLFYAIKEYGKGRSLFYVIYLLHFNTLRVPSQGKKIDFEGVVSDSEK
jgi:hypothetical protein